MPPSDRGAILVVDDDADIRLALRETLEVEGYVVAEAASGLDALAYLGSHPLPPLILLDWNMSSMDGPQFMIELAKERRFDGVPVVLLTADVHAPQKYRSARFSAYLTKPVNLDRLFGVIEKLAGG